MKYKKIEVGPYNLHVVTTDRFKINRIVINFKRLARKEEITMRNLLNDVLLSSTKEYSTQRLLNMKTEELYGVPYGGNTYLSGNYSMMGFSMEFLNDKYTPEPIFEDCIDFLMNILFNPNVKDGKFDERNFNICKNNLENSIKSFSDNPRRYSLRRMQELLGKDSLISYHGDGYIEDLEKISPKRLYEYYKDVIRKDWVDIFVIGDVNVDEVKRIITSKMKINTLKKKSGSHFIIHKDYRKRSQSLIEKKDINQSKLCIGLKLKNITPFETNYVSSIYSFILGGSADSLLFKSVREKHSMCYYISSSIYKVSNLLVIDSGINANNYKKVVKLVKKELKNLALGKFDEKYIENGKAMYLNAYKDICDTPADLLNIYISNEYLGSDLLDVKEKEILKVDKKSVVEFANKVYLDTIYLLEGGDTNGD